MCGIAGFHVKPGCKIERSALENFADSLLYEIDHRGGDACGFAALSSSGELVLQRASCVARTFSEERRSFPDGVRTVLLHTRFATQGDAAFPENNHPISTGSIHCTHNGHISNDNELIRAAGIARIGRVDSEAIPATVALRGWENVGRALEELEGAAAVALLDSSTGSLVLARAYSSPLVVVESAGLVVWASTREAIHYAWRETLGTPPHDSRFEIVREGTLLRYEPNGSKSRESFSTYEPVYVTRYYEPASGKQGARGGAWSADKPLGGAADEARKRERVGRSEWWDETYEEELKTLSLEECSCCGDFYPSGELSTSYYEGWRVCGACSKWFGSALETDPTALTAEEEEEERERGRLRLLLGGGRR